MSNQEKKFNEVEIILGGLTTLTVDAIAFLLDLTVYGYIIATPLQAFTSFATSCWMKSKGDKNAFIARRLVTKQLSNFLPLIPTCFAFFVYEVIKLNNETIGAIVSIVENPEGGKVAGIVSKSDN